MNVLVERDEEREEWPHGPLPQPSFGLLVCGGDERPFVRYTPWLLDVQGTAVTALQGWMTVGRRVPEGLDGQTGTVLLFLSKLTLQVHGALHFLRDAVATESLVRDTLDLYLHRIGPADVHVDGVVEALVPRVIGLRFEPQSVEVSCRWPRWRGPLAERH